MPPPARQPPPTARLPRGTRAHPATNLAPPNAFYLAPVSSHNQLINSVEETPEEHDRELDAYELTETEQQIVEWESDPYHIPMHVVIGECSTSDEEEAAEMIDYWRSEREFKLQRQDAFLRGRLEASTNQDKVHLDDKECH